jgi:hypothetical protein
MGCMMVYKTPVDESFDKTNENTPKKDPAKNKRSSIQNFSHISEHYSQSFKNPESGSEQQTIQKKSRRLYQSAN